MNLLQDVFKIVIPAEWSAEGSKHGTNVCKETSVGHFKVIIDEAGPDQKEIGKGIGIKGHDVRKVNAY